MIKGRVIYKKMNQSLNLKINTIDSLLIATKSDDYDFIIDLNNAVFVAYLQHQNNKIKIHRFAVGYDLYYFSEHIQKCIEGKINIPIGLDRNIDLGLLWNEHWQKISLAEDSGHPLPTWKWVASDTVFFQNKSDGDFSNNTFLYNDQQGNIILQVSLAYPWFFTDAPSNELNISYYDWLLKYKIVYKSMIPREIAQQWVLQLNELYAQLDKNMQT